MPLRFIDTGFFKHPFVVGLKGPYKSLYLFILCDCDNAGMWSPEFQVASIYTDQKVDKESASKIFRGKFIELGNGKWFFPDFIQWQYPKGLSNTNPAHSKVIKLLSQFELIDENLIIKGPSKDLRSTFKGTKEEEEEEGMGKAADKGKVVGGSPKMKVISTHTICREFYESHQAINGRECNWNGKYAGSLSHILGKLKITFAKANGREPTEEDLYNSFVYLIKHVPDFYKDKDLATVNSKYDSIINEIKNGKPTSTAGKKGGYSDDELLSGLEEYRRRNQVANSK